MAVLPVQTHQVDGAVVLVEKTDVVLGLAFPVDPDPGLGASRVPGPAHDGLVFDPDLVGRHDQHVGAGPVLVEFSPDVAHPGLNGGRVGSAPVNALGPVERQARHVQQEVVGRIGLVDHLETIPEPLGHARHVPETGR